MPSYKLTYFNGRGRAELCRLLFTLAGQEFEDVRMTSEEWQKFKPNTLLGQLPVMEIDGKMFSQSSAMASYLAKEFGYYGKTNLEGLKIDEIISILGDFLQQAVKAMFAEEDKKEAAQKEFKENQIPKYMGALEKKIKDSSSGYFVGSTVTLADIAVYDLTSGMSLRFPGFLDNFPGLKELNDKIGNMDKIKAYVEKRPVTQF